jgi:ABC-2 type transport system permease protein
VSRPAPFVRVVAAQAAMEVRLTARRGESLLAMVVLPAVALVYFGTVGFGAGPASIDRLLPAILALAIVASCLVNLGIATAYERGYGVLKRLGGAPLGKAGLIIAKLTVVAAIAILQVIALVALATALGWSPSLVHSWGGVGLVTVAGVATFAGIGMLIAGSLRADAAMVVANALFLVAILTGGMIVPTQDLPGVLAAVTSLLPFGALTNAFDAMMTGAGDLTRSLVVLLAWAAAAFIGAARTFRWE